MGFEFRPRAKLPICGREYEVDIADVGFVTAMVSSFAGLLRHYQEMERLRGELTQAAAGMDEGKIEEYSRTLAETNEKLCTTAREFIAGTLGEEAYRQIFAGRRPNSADHVQLCAYIYTQALKAREEEVLKPLTHPPQGGRPQNAATAPHHRRRRKKGTDRHGL